MIETLAGAQVMILTVAGKIRYAWKTEGRHDCRVVELARRLEGR